MFNNISGGYGSGMCSLCNGFIPNGTLHTCSGPRQFTGAPTPAPSLYTIQCCPVCEGRGNVPTNFYSRGTGATSTEPEVCRSCDGKGLLKVGMLGTVEKAT